jgi:hypothetical protein
MPWRRLLLCLQSVPLLLAGSSACAGDREREADRAYTAGIAQVERVEIETRPGARHAVAVVHGFLPDACTELDRVERMPAGPDALEITLTTRRPFGAMCAQVLQPFTRRIELSVFRTPVIYTVTVNGVTTSAPIHPPPGTD